MGKTIQGRSHYASEIISFDDSAECDLFYEELKIVFYNIDTWGLLFDNSIHFYRVQPAENSTSFNSLRQKLVKIKIPGIPNNLGGGYDWVETKDYEYHIKVGFTTIRFTISPCCKPGNNLTTHFYTPEAKTHFVIKKFIKHINVEVHGRDEIPNYKGLSFYKKFRNFYMANGGIFGMSKVHWEIWCKNILDEKYIKKCIEKDQNRNNQYIY